MSKLTNDKPKTNNFQRIRELGYKQQGIISLMLIERMKPNYYLFAHVTDFPQEHNLDNMINSLWERLLVKGAKVSLSAMEDKIELLTPDEHEFDMYGVYPALYFCTAVLSYINGLQSEDDLDPVAVAKISQGCIVHLIEYQADTELDNDAVREHELMQNEMAFLSSAIDFVESLPLKQLDAKSIRQKAIEFALADGVTNIGIEFEV
ncbi:YjaG family protein [Psychrosphaera sp. 1_MG-2023]|uniref:YjaG family protein n=1 Tax=Psychrosphaera sp. 1_MG-2023 TaxID=3062643 RepID=UPI0026E185C2|nr:YjaG family protein [Psychrosphaera sp. 1_MG-2023]MDO6718206.1 YjaG family protein [Psychrosphaera sp. 1_MG-2023]